MPPVNPECVDRSRLAYAISMRWYLLGAGVLGSFLVVDVFGLNLKLLAAGLAGGLSVAALMSGAAFRKNQAIFIGVILILVSMYFLPHMGRQFRGQVYTCFFFFGLVSFSLSIILINRQARL